MPEIIDTIRKLTGLVDTPSTYIGNVNKGLIVNSFATGVEFVTYGFKEITEGGNTGIRRVTSLPGFYGPIGDSAIDLSFSTVPSVLHGALGDNAFAAGTDNTASGFSSAVFGNNNTTSGSSSAAFGFSNVVDGLGAIAFGFNNQVLNTIGAASGDTNIARGRASHAFGLYNDVDGARSAFAFGDSCKTIASASFLSGIALDAGDSYGVFITGTANETFVGAGVGDLYLDTDPLFIAGNGTYNRPVGAAWTANVRSNALFLDKGGRLFLPSVDNT